MPEILILADDLSGAADCAGGCAAVGLDTLVLLAPPLHFQATASVIAIDLDTRDKPGDDAGLAVAQAIERARGPATKVAYQKIDSTLRGSWAQALAAALKSLGTATEVSPLALIAPAFPARGRITRDGRVLVVARAQGSGRAEMTDVGEIAAPLRQVGLSVRNLDREDLNASTPGLADRFVTLAGAIVDAVVCDAETDQDLAAIAAAGLAAGVPLLWVGSAGLMRPLAASFAPERPTLPPMSLRCGPLLFVVGSAAAVARAQFAVLAAEPEIAVVRVRPGDLEITARAQRLGAELDAALAAGADTAVAIDAASSGHASLDPGVVLGIADLVAPRLERCGGLVATGGETARRLLDKAGIKAIRLGGEVEVGVPWGIGLDARGEPGLPVVTKAGAFGDPGTLVNCRKALKAMET
jgi:D-threonate/D-erythronate kinase